MTRKEWIPYGIALLALLAGAFYDYQITDALHDSSSIFGLFFERIVLIPVQFVVVFTPCLLYRKYKNPLFLVVSIAACLYVVQHALSYWVSTKGNLMLAIMVVFAILITLITSILLKSVSDQWINEHMTFFLFFTVVLLTATLVTTILKVSWGRIRYRDMSDAAQFCVWYKPCGLAGNRSFPSGHTTAISAVLCLLQWHTNRYQKPTPLTYIFVGSMILLMAISRMVMGAHFLSDTAAGFLVCYSVYLLYRKSFQRRGYL